ncbi:MAG: hypothetical protein JWO58_2472 [Chitinophagaceae bacterium]|nr:hypothetical protein [Chitinophagaceae bacterium]
MKNKIQIPKYLLFVIFAALTLPFIQRTVSLVEESPLGGVIPEPTEVPALSKETWLSGEYQVKKEKKISEEFGFRNFCIRTHNQIAFTLFHKAQAKDVIVGKENYLFEERYIKAYYGADFIGEDSTKHRMQRLKFVQDTLAKLNKTLLIVFAAGKGSYYPEYIPDRYITKRKRTNYEAHLDYANQYGINHIDFNKYFVEQKYKYKHLLYPKNGIHWSTYGAAIAADSIIKYLEKKRAIDMPTLYWNEKDIRFAPEEYWDYDIGEGINVFYRLPSEPMAYPVILYESDSAKTKPSTLVVSDSFYWPMYNMGLPNVFSYSKFWYYNQEIHPGSGSPAMIDLGEELNQRDVIVLMASEVTISDFGWGFIEDMYKLYTNQLDLAKFKSDVEGYKNYIKNDKNWVEGAAKRAAQNSISVDSMITLDAIWEVKRAMRAQHK